MTLLAIHADATRAQIMTDTRSADHIGRTWSRGTKFFHLAHLDAGLVTQGSSSFGNRATLLLGSDSGFSGTFDDLLSSTPAALRRAWSRLSGEVTDENAEHGSTVALADSVVFLAGYSDAAQGFVAVGFASDHDFEPRPVSGLHVQPSPFHLAPSTLELERLRRHFRLNGLDVTALGQTKTGENPAPDTTEAWEALARAVRRDRALAPIASGLKWVVGGDVLLTTIERGSSTTERLLTFGDAGEEFREMVAGTLHPMGQAGPCVCDSGKRLIDCCVQLTGQQCPCGSGRIFGDCCSIDAGVASQDDASLLTHALAKA